MTRLIHMARIAMPLSLLLISLILSGESAAGVTAGARIACSAALPALFPALVLSKLISSSGMPGGRFTPLFLGLTCGFPVGALAVCDLKNRGGADKRIANRLLFCCCNTGPAFIVGYCGRMILGSVKAGVILYLTQCAIALILFLFLVPKSPVPQAEKKPLPLSAAIGEGALDFLRIAGCVIFFSFLSSLLFAVLPDRWIFSKSAAGLFLEITGGMARLRSLPFAAAFPLCGMGIGWAGLSVLAQTAESVKRAGLNLKWYIAGRAATALLMTLLSFPLKKLL